ncbi:sulfite exporter TauE/SafE family protein [Polaribacter tangerinus]|uniref:sulfite exporter TauE/SafE family protein n=1 Tax=Polaribacter tangerinus TaxID=1920034 RepID=UPI000B4A8570|nr:sulfite exporter TauE/SafE family protein [Polaribacter tangerinus]
MILEFLTILENEWWVILLFLIVAIIYASVGFGGGSSYLAILALSAMAYTEIRAMALICNIVVVSGNVLIYQKQKILEWKKIIPLVSLSIPFAYLGGFLKINEYVFFTLLSITLLFAAFTMWFSTVTEVTSSINKKNDTVKNSLYGAIVGFLSGMVGIGGGIFLAPLLHVTRWDISKKIAATASFFILVNSIAGLFGQFTNSNFVLNWKLTIILAFTVFIGGQIGGILSAKKLSAVQLKKATALLIAFVSIRILWKVFLTF